DSEGKRVLDGSGGAAVSCLGHSNAAVVEAMKKQLDQIAYAHTGFFSTEVAETLAQSLVSLAPEGIDRVYLVSGGSEAVEAAIKLARQYYVERGEPQRRHIISRRQSYHGNTLGALAAGGNEWRRQQFAPILTDTAFVSPCYAYRDQADGESAEAYGLRVANELEAEILRLGSDTVMAFTAEPVVGATMGAVAPVPGYFKRIREICDQYGVLLILDEVMCGMGRTGSLFACEQEDIRPDIITVAKGLGAGYQPVGAMLCSANIYQTIADGSGFFQHGHTYMGHPLAAAAAQAVLNQISTPEMMQTVRRQGEKLQDALCASLGQHPNVGDIRGRGLFRGVELVADRDSKQPFDPARAINKAIKRHAFEAGLACYPMGGTIDGVNGDHVLLAPPFIISDAQIEELVQKLTVAIDKAIAG
ncbi:MAG: aspartate aminotransferase family protein, partial [Granulosicoccaceae bacterium]